MKKYIALFLAAVLMLGVFAGCGGKKTEEPAAPAAAANAAPAPAGPDAPAPAGPAAPAPDGEPSGEPSGDPTGEPPEPAQLFEPDRSYSKDWAGYQQYVIDAFQSDPHVPEELKATAAAEIQAATDDSADVFGKFLNAGLILNYADFLAF